MLNEAVNSQRELLNDLRSINQAIKDNGFVYLEKINSQTRAKCVECEFELDEYNYIVAYQAFPAEDFESEIIIREVRKCHAREDEYGKPLEKMHITDINRIMPFLQKDWLAIVPDDFWDDYNADPNADSCPVNDDTKLY